MKTQMGDGSRLGMEVRYSYDGEKLLGTGGALRRAAPLLGDVFWVMYGDSYMDIDYPAVLDAFVRSGADGLMTVLRNGDRWDKSNVVFRDGLPAALIDFDLAKPTTRLAEVGNALRYWVPLRDPVDRAPGFRELDAAARIGVFADAYGLDEARRARLVPLLIERARASLAWAETAAAADPVFRRFWENDWRQAMPRAVTWLEQESSHQLERL